MIGTDFGGGVMNVIELIICGYEKWTASNLSLVIDSPPNPMSADCKKLKFLEFQKQRVIIL